MTNDTYRLHGDVRREDGGDIEEIADEFFDEFIALFEKYGLTFFGFFGIDKED